MKIRTLHSSDIADAYSIFQRAVGHSVSPSGPPRWTREQFASECANLALIVEVGGALAAFVLARDNGAAVEISFLATDPAFMRQGIMVELLRHLRASAQKPLWLEVHEANHPARALYEKIGFEKTGERPRYYSDGGRALLYTLA